MPFKRILPSYTLLTARMDTLRSLSQVELLTITVSMGALIVSAVATVFTISAYVLKSGQRFRASYMLQSSATSDRYFIRHLLIENLKDKSVVIFDIYLRIGQNIYVELESFEDSPLVLGPFEVAQRTYDPPVYYALNMRSVDVPSLIEQKQPRKLIVLATNTGRRKVKAHVQRWHVMSDWVHNHTTAPVRPMRIPYRAVSYGPKTHYLIDITRKDGKHEVIPVTDDISTRVFAGFALTPEALESEEHLRAYIEKQWKAGTIEYEDVRVIDYQKAIEKAYKLRDHTQQQLRPLNWLVHRIVGPVFTSIESARIRRKNRRRTQKSQQSDR